MAAAKNVKLAALLDRGVREIVYTYDMGDDWRHTITLETVGAGEPDVKYPRFIKGERRCPPEDVGGLPGFEMFLGAMADPTHEEHDSLREWYGGPYNADDIDERFTRRAVAAASPAAPSPPSPSAATPANSSTRKAALSSKAVYRPRLLFIHAE